MMSSASPNRTFTMDDISIIDLESQSMGRDDSWLMAYDRDGSEPEWPTHSQEEIASASSSKSLVQKLDEISKNFSVSNSSVSSNGMSPAVYVSRRERILNSTPIAKRLGFSDVRFDSRTFTRPSKRQKHPRGTDQHLNLTFDKLRINSSTFSKDELNDTFVKDSSCPGDEAPLNETFDLKPSLNSTFTRRPEDRLSTSPLTGNTLLETVNHGDQDEVLSTTSDSSLSHRLNDVGDVKHIAKLQEESLKQQTRNSSEVVVVIQQPYVRSATMSPSSEHSPSTEDGNPGRYQSEDGSLASNGDKSRYQQQYSSQDSLPDSPYSSQSLDSQPAQNLDRIGRSMPNLNKIRRSGVPSMVGGSRLPPPPSAGSRCYGLSSRQHASSDPRLQKRSSDQQYPPPPPSRGTVYNGPNKEKTAPASFIRPTRTSAPAARQSTGIPRPGFRVSSGIPRTSGIPKPGGPRQSFAKGGSSRYN